VGLRAGLDIVNLTRLKKDVESIMHKDYSLVAWIYTSTYLYTLFLFHSFFKKVSDLHKGTFWGFQACLVSYSDNFRIFFTYKQHFIHA
jgi:hypothetical protein